MIEMNSYGRQKVIRLCSTSEVRIEKHTINIDKSLIDKNQILNLIQRIKQEDKIYLLEQLKEDTFPERFEQLLASLKTDELTLEEITEEVEEVRQKRFEGGKHKEASVKSTVN